MQYAKKSRRGSQRQQGWPVRHNQSGWRDVVPAAAHLPATVKDALLPRGEIAIFSSVEETIKRSHFTTIKRSHFKIIKRIHSKIFNKLIDKTLSNCLLQKFGENPKWHFGFSAINQNKLFVRNNHLTYSYSQKI